MEGWDEKRRHGGRNSSHPSIEHAINAKAGRQHGVVALEQLIEIGLSASAVRSRVATGRLHRVHRGVFVVDPAPLTGKGRWMAAVLACGDGAVLSHRSAAALWGLRADNRAVIDVTVPRRGGRERRGIDVHHSSTLIEPDTTDVDGIPCTSLARTPLDLAEVVDRRGVERAIDRAEMLRLFDMRAVDDVLARASGRRGASLLRSVLAEHHAGSTLTESEIEELLLAICRTAGLPSPEVNAWVALDDGGGFRPDVLWREQRLIVETDGRDVHSTRQAFERDRKRDQRLMLAGWRVVRFTWRQITREPRRVAEMLRALLAQADLAA